MVVGGGGDVNYAGDETGGAGGDPSGLLLAQFHHRGFHRRRRLAGTGVRPPALRSARPAVPASA